MCSQEGPSLLCAKLTRSFSTKERDQYVGTAFEYWKQSPDLPAPVD
jgi:hypothetical protein